MADPIPYVVKESGGAGAAPDGSIPIALFGAGGGGGGGAVDSVNGQIGEVELEIDDIPGLTDTLAEKALASEVSEALLAVQTQFTSTNAAVAEKLDSSTFTSYTTAATEAFGELENAVQTNTNNLENTTATANAAVQPDNLRLPILLTQAQYDALVTAGTVVPGQIYITT